MAKAILPLPNMSGKMIGVLVIFVVLLVVAGAGYYFYMQYQKTQKMLENPTEAAKEEVSDTVKKVGDLILLPKDEDPTLATVSDKSKLANQAFFANAENGDKVLIFTKSKKAYLYRPSINKIIDVAPVNIGTTVAQQPVTIAASGTPSPASSGTPSPSAKPSGKPSVTPSVTPTPTSAFKPVNVAIYNGTKTIGLAATEATRLKTAAPNVTVVAKANAADTYTESVVVDFTGKYAKEAVQLAKLVNGSVGVLPKNEVKPTADILVILGPQQ